MQRKRRRRQRPVRPRLAFIGAALLLLSSIFFLFLPPSATDGLPTNALLLLPGLHAEEGASDLGLVSVAYAAQSIYNPVLKVYDAESKKLIDQTLEKYVECVVSGEVPSSFHDEAVKAQAVAARTLAVYKMRALGGKGCSKHPEADVCTDSGHCQAYKANARDARFARLCAETVNEIITYGGEPIQVFYHSTSGGMTEDVQNVFSVRLPYLVSVASGGEENAPRFTGQVALSRKEFIQKVNAKYGSAKLSDKALAASVKITARNASGRVTKVKLGGAVATGIEMRKLFGLNSANFTIELTAKQVILHTVGYGHGVGMSQAGANAMAQNGATYQEILLHYYTGVQFMTFSANMDTEQKAGA